MTVDFDIIVTYYNHRDPHYFTGLSYDPAANRGAGGFVTSDEHSGEWLRDQQQAREQFEQAKVRFAAKRNLTVSLWRYESDAQGHISSGGIIAEHRPD